MRDDSGAGAMLALMMVGAVVIVTFAVLGMGGALVTRQRVIGAADAAALAAADAASGAIAGEPCAVAAAVARANLATVGSCRIDGLIATVTVTGAYGAVPFRAVSTAGPAP